MSSISSRPDDQPNQRRAARKVSRDSSWPGSTLMSTWVCDSIQARISSPLSASRTADVANAISSCAPLSSARRSASMTKSRSCTAQSWVSRLAASRWSPRRSSALCENAGSGRAPWCASTTSRCTVLEPTSRTPKRIPKRYPHCAKGFDALATARQRRVPGQAACICIHGSGAPRVRARSRGSR